MDLSFADLEMNVLAHYFRVQKINDFSFYVYFHGPRQIPYVGGIWIVRVTLSERYPQECPRIHFVGHIIHPNIDIRTGLVCPSALGLLWDPTSSDVLEIFQSYLEILLNCPNTDVKFLNEEAGELWRRDKELYGKIVQGSLFADSWPRQSCSLPTISRLRSKFIDFCTLRMLLLIVALMVLGILLFFFVHRT